MRSIETHAVEVRIVVDLDAVAHGIAVSLTHIEGKTDGCTAGGSVVKTQNGAVDVGFVAIAFTIETLAFVGRAENVNPRRNTGRARSIEAGERSAAFEGSGDLIVHIKRGVEGTAGKSHDRSRVNAIKVIADLVFQVLTLILSNAITLRSFDVRDVVREPQTTASLSWL